MEIVRCLLIASVFANLYSVLHHGLLSEFSYMWVSVIKALGWSFLVEHLIEQKN